MFSMSAGVGIVSMVDWLFWVVFGVQIGSGGCRWVQFEARGLDELDFVVVFCVLRGELGFVDVWWFDPAKLGFHSESKSCGVL